MAITHNLGFPRIGAQRELKFALEAYWQQRSSLTDLQDCGQQLREQNWQRQAGLDWLPVGDFSFYDQVLDHSFLLGHLPERAQGFDGEPLDNYFRIARGRSANTPSCCQIHASDMTKWFDTNYHYLVPEFSDSTRFELNPAKLLAELSQAQKLGHQVKPVIIGPITYLWLGKARDGFDRLSLLPALLDAYVELLGRLRDQGIDWLQIDEPALVTELTSEWQQAYQQAYAALANQGPKLLLTSYFGGLHANLGWVCQLPVQGLHVDAVYGRAELDAVLAAWPTDRVLSLGVINGRNIWKTDLNACLDWLEPIAAQRGDTLWLAPSCSLLHVPVDLALETGLNAELSDWLAFAVQKIDELRCLAQALNQGRASVQAQLDANRQALQSRKTSPRVHRPAVKAALAAISADLGTRSSPYPIRAAQQAAWLKLPLYPTTTIGSFPQTAEIRQSRRQFKTGQLDESSYRQQMQQAIADSVRQQEALGLDVLVHGEAERNDMVEYFGEQLDGYAFSQFGWVQSYGSRCVKPPILFGDIERSQPMTLDWIRYAQSLTAKPMKGMLTGPVTMLNWSFVRDDQPRSTSCLQLALAIRSEVQDLERAGIHIIQIDEAALREGLPLRRSQWQEYLDWAVLAFRISANGVADHTQIHTHMCYSEFNDILPSIAAMDADVITIETSRSAMELLDAFQTFDYPNQIGPGVYDIHSPNIPSTEQIVELMQLAAQRIPAERLWINPDCGLKTRQWPEVIPALTHMVAAAQQLRAAS